MDNLFHRYRLRQVTRLINVSALEHSNVVRQQLQRNGVEDRRQDVVDVRHLHHVGAFAVGHPGFLVSDPDGYTIGLGSSFSRSLTAKATAVADALKKEGAESFAIAFATTSSESAGLPSGRMLVT